MPLPKEDKPRKGTVDQLEQMPHRKRMRARGHGSPARSTSGWKRSSRGNLCRLFNKRFRAVVIRPNESSRKEEYSWVIGDSRTDLCDFSPTKYPTEEEAFSALVDELAARGIR